MDENLSAEEILSSLKRNDKKLLFYLDNTLIYVELC